MMNNKKGQGALEYLLLIGGAVLIAVIVIALLVGMGGQSRETAQDQATKASKTLDQPQPATIVSVMPLSGAAATITGTCTEFDAVVPASGDGQINMNWQKLGEGGVYTVRVYNYNNVALNIGTAINPATTSVEVSASPVSLVIDRVAGQGSCNDSYWVEMTTEKNGQSVTSTRMKFNW